MHSVPRSYYHGHIVGTAMICRALWGAVSSWFHKQRVPRTEPRGGSQVSLEGYQILEEARRIVENFEAHRRH
jgi:hypothetical protein